MTSPAVDYDDEDEEREREREKKQRAYDVQQVNLKEDLLVLGRVYSHGIYSFLPLVFSSSFSLSLLLLMKLR